LRGQPPSLLTLMDGPAARCNRFSQPGGLQSCINVSGKRVVLRAMMDISAHYRRTSSLTAIMPGRPGFFAPRVHTHWLFGGKVTSCHDTDGLKSTLERLVDFDCINARETRFSIAVVNVRTGNFAYFDNAATMIRAEHVMASDALPPGFPAIEIDGEHYWDRGLISNTPLQYVTAYVPRRKITVTLCTRN
jgi:NTE family protein